MLRYSKLIFTGSMVGAAAAFIIVPQLSHKDRLQLIAASKNYIERASNMIDDWK
jgi:gas vesicle protein